MSDTSKGGGRTATGGSSEGFTAEERAAMRDRAKEMKADAKRGRPDREAGEADIREKIAGMPAEDRAMAERVHAIVMESAPDLMPRTWYGMPAYAKDGRVVCFFQPASKFKARYAQFGFNDAARLDDGTMWPVVYAITELTPAAQKGIAAAVKKAVR